MDDAQELRFCCPLVVIEQHSLCLCGTGGETTREYSSIAAAQRALKVRVDPAAGNRKGVRANGVAHQQRSRSALLQVGRACKLQVLMVCREQTQLTCATTNKYMTGLMEENMLLITPRSPVYYPTI